MDDKSTKQYERRRTPEGEATLSRLTEIPNAAALAEQVFSSMYAWVGPVVSAPAEVSQAPNYVPYSPEVHATIIDLDTEREQRRLEAIRADIEGAHDAA